MSFDLDRVLSKVSNRDNLAVTLFSHEEIAPKVHRVVCTLNRDAGAEKNFEALQNFFAPNASPVECSFTRLSESEAGKVVTVGFVTPNRIVKELTDDVKASMTTIAKNVMMDPTDKSMWNIARTPSGDCYITRQEDEDLNTAFAAISSGKHRLGIPEIAAVVGCDTKVGTYVGYVDAETASVRFGYVLTRDDTTSTVYNRDMEETTVDNRMIVAAIEGVMGEDNHLERLISASGKKTVAGLDGKELKDYYKKVYNYSPEFYNQMERIIDESTNVVA